MDRLTGTVAWRLTLWFLLLSVIPIALMAMFLSRNVSDAFTALALSDARAEARLIATGLARHGATPPDTIEWAALLGEGRAIILLDRRGQVVSEEASPSGGGDDAAPPVLIQRVRTNREGEWRDPASERLFAWASVPEGDATVVVSLAPTVVGLPMARIERSSLTQLAVSLALISIAGGIAIWIVIGPIQQLTAAARDIGAGNLDVQLDPEEMEGELAVLTDSFNQMAGELRGSYALLEQQVAERSRELATINTIASAVGRSLDLQPTLDDALATVLTQLDFDAGAVCLADEASDFLCLASCDGFEGALCDFAPWSPVAQRVALTGQPIVRLHLDDDPDLPPSVAGAGFRRLAAVPMSARGQVEGVLVLAGTEARAIDAAETELLVSIGHQVGVGVQNARLGERTGQLAVLEERQRLARDLHDSVTQQLYAVTLYAEAAARLLGAGEPEKGIDLLRQVRMTGQEALQEMRLLIYELRPPDLEEKGMANALQARLDAVEGRAGLETKLEVDCPAELPKPVEEALYRVAQEALNNALKHAHARRIRVALSQGAETGWLRLEVVDDGDGMDVAAARASGGLGLRGMEERVAALGGRLNIDSAPGQGTTISVEVPT